MIPARLSILLAALAGLGWPSMSNAQQANSYGAHTVAPRDHHDIVLERLAAAEQEIRQLQRKLGDRGATSGRRIERFPPVVPLVGLSQIEAAVRPVAFHSRHPSATPGDPAPELIPLDASAAFANYEPDEELSFDDDTQIVEPEGGEVDTLNESFDSQDQASAGIGLDLYGTSNFLDGLLIESENAVMKIGGFVKADLIHDFDPIDTQDVFDTTAIPVGAAPRKNSRFHARQSRLNFDVRWPTDHGMARVFVEGDFFGGSEFEEETARDRFRLRHAYGKIDSWTFGQTWSTFADDRAQPYTLDFEGAASSISRRQALVRYTTPIGSSDAVSLSLAVEDARVIVEVPDSVEGSPRSESPDFVVRIRNNGGFARFQIAGVFREIGFQKVGEPVVTGDAFGVNISGDARLTDNDRVYSQIVWGDGIGSYKGLPDVAGKADGTAGVLGMFGWMVGWTHNWTDRLSSNFTYSENRIGASAFAAPDDLRENTYFAVNLIAQPVERVFVGAEYLYGTRENVDGARGHANRLQFSFGFYLP